MTDQPRAYTAEELRDLLIDSVRGMAEYWAAVPNKSRVEMANGLAFSILAILDGSSDLPCFDLVAQPHENDKEYSTAEGANWIEPGTTISDMLHEHYYPPISTAVV